MNLAKLALISLIIAMPIQAGEPDIDDEGNGILISELDAEGFGYLVDTVTKLCFAYQHTTFSGSTRTLVKIDCSNLKNRKEWKPILTWEK